MTGAWFILVFQFNVGNTVSYIAGTAYTTTGSAMPTGAQQVRLGASAGNAAPEMRVSDVAVWDNVTVTDEQIRLSLVVTVYKQQTHRIRLTTTI